MGVIYRFCCPHCGYEALVSGGKDCNFMVETETRLCSVCNKIVDVITAFQGRYEPHERESMDRCPDCYSMTRIPWKMGDPCPKCGFRMERGNREILQD
jgi:hypothetical protein